MDRKDEKSYAMCPKCGTELFKARTANGAEVCCRKCKRKYEVKLQTESLQLREITATYSA